MVVRKSNAEEGECAEFMTLLAEKKQFSSRFNKLGGVCFYDVRVESWLLIRLTSYYGNCTYSHRSRLGVCFLHQHRLQYPLLDP